MATWLYIAVAWLGVSIAIAGTAWMLCRVAARADERRRRVLAQHGRLTLEELRALDAARSGTTTRRWPRPAERAAQPAQPARERERRRQIAGRAPPPRD